MQLFVESILDRVYDYVIYRDLLVTIIQIRQFEWTHILTESLGVHHSVIKSILLIYREIKQIDAVMIFLLFLFYFWRMEKKEAEMMDGYLLVHVIRFCCVVSLITYDLVSPNVWLHIFLVFWFMESVKRSLVHP